MQATVRLTHGGRFVIPAAIRKLLHMKDGTNWMIKTEGEGFRVVPIKEAVHELQNLLAPWLEGAPSLADELIAERRTAAAKEYKRHK